MVNSSGEKCMFGAHENCCTEGMRYALAYPSLPDRDEVIIPNVVCYAQAQVIAAKKKFPNRCLLAYYKSCENMLWDILGKFILGPLFVYRSQLLF